MAAPSQGTSAGQISQALIGFTVDGSFPEEAVSTLALDPAVLPAAIEALAATKAKLQVGVQPCFV